MELGNCYEAALVRGRFMLLFCGHDVRGALAGNGGEMAEAKQELKARKSSGNKQSSPNKKPKSRAGSKATRKAGTKARPQEVKEASSAEEACGDGSELLREAANRELAKRSEKIAEQLGRKAEQGDRTSTKMLVDLSAGKKLALKKRPGWMSDAQILTLDKPWQGPLDGEDGDARTEQGPGTRD